MHSKKLSKNFVHRNALNNQSKQYFVIQTLRFHRKFGAYPTIQWFNRQRSNFKGLAIVNCCVLTGKSRGLLTQQNRLSRNQFKLQVNQGLLYPYKKISW